MLRRVVVTGVSVVAPNGVSVEEFFKNSLAGKCFIKEYKPDFSEIKSRIVGRIAEFDQLLLDLKLTDFGEADRYLVLALACAKQAILDANLTNGEGLLDSGVRSEDVGVTFATAIGGTSTMEKVFAELTNKGLVDLPLNELRDNLYDAAMFNSVASRIGSMIGAMNACQTISTGCTAGLDAIGHAFETVAIGDARVMIVGAAEAPITGITFASFDIVGALSKRNDDPARASRPFDGERDGFVLSEGAAFFVLEDLEHAMIRGANIIAEIVGFSSSNNAYHMTDLPRDGEALGKALMNLPNEAGDLWDSIDYINGHGSSTLQNDIFETNAYKRAFEAKAYNIPISSTKSMIGHPLSAASAIGTVAAILAITHNVLFPTINYETPDPECDLDYIPNQYREASVEKVVVTASGFSGIHSALLLEQFIGGEKVC